MMQPQNSEAMQKVVMAGMKMMYDAKVFPMFADALEKDPSPMGIAKQTAGLMKILMDKSQGSMPRNVMIPAAVALLFEMAGFIVEVKAPIFVFREWHRHRTQSYNEMSARYAPLPDFNYIPTVERCLVVNCANKQANAATGAAVLTHERALAWLEKLTAYYEQGEALYQEGLSDGIPKELARLSLTVGRYSRMRASANLRNWLAFLTLRSDVVSHAAG